MTASYDFDETVEHEIWTRCYLRAINVEDPEAAAATAEAAVALYTARWKTLSGEQLVSDERRYENSVLGARLASCVRYRDR